MEAQEDVVAENEVFLLRERVLLEQRLATDDSDLEAAARGVSQLVLQTEHEARHWLWQDCNTTKRTNLAINVNMSTFQCLPGKSLCY